MGLVSGVFIPQHATPLRKDPVHRCKLLAPKMYGVSEDKQIQSTCNSYSQLEVLACVNTYSKSTIKWKWECYFLIFPSVFLMSHQAIHMGEVKRWRCSSLTNMGTTSVIYCFACTYDEFTATVCISAMLMKRDQAPRYVEMSLQRSSEPSWSSHAFLTLNIISVNLALTVSSLNGAFNKILR